jgi:integrase
VSAAFVASTTTNFLTGFGLSAAARNEKMRLHITKLGIGHVTPHGLRSYFVTQARQSGLNDAEIAMLIGSKTGPSLIAQVYEDLRDDHLMKQAQRIRLHATGHAVETAASAA